MKNNINNKEIIDCLTINSINGLSKTEKDNLLNKINNKFRNNNMKKYFGYGLGFLSLVLVGMYLVNTYMLKPTPQAVDKVIAVLENKGNNAGDSAMKIAVDDHDSISKAQEVLSFEVLRPTEVFGGQLYSVQTAKTFDNTKSDHIFLNFAKDNDIYLNINESKIEPANQYVPEKYEKVELNINGTKVVGYFEKMEVTDIDPNSEQALYGGTSSKSSLTFYVNGVSVLISEFGKLSKENLVQIANSL